MLVNYKNANMLVVEMGEGKQKLMLVPGINVIDDKGWEGAKSTLDAKVKAGIVVPIYKTTKKDGKEVEEPCKPDDIFLDPGPHGGRRPRNVHLGYGPGRAREGRPEWEICERHPEPLHDAGEALPLGRPDGLVRERRMGEEGSRRSVFSPRNGYNVPLRSRPELGRA